MGSAIVLPASPANAATGIDLCAEVGRNAGWDPTNGTLVTAVAIAMAESGCNPAAVNTANRNGSTDRGLWQINSIHTWVTVACTFDPQCNANAAFKISSSGAKWTPWSVYNSGKYKTFLVAARDAVARLSGVPDGQFVRHGGEVFRMAGGAPIVVSDWAKVGGDPGAAMVLDLTDAQWAGLAAVPRDGTYLRGSAPGQSGDGSLFRVAGGAPIFVSDWSAVGGDPGTSIPVDLTAIQNAGQPGSFSHLAFQPSDGTILNAAGITYKVVAGAPIKQSASLQGTTVDPLAIANAGEPGAWSHLAAPPGATATTTRTTSNPSRAAAPSAIAGVRVWAPRRRTAVVSWTAVRGATSYRVRISKANTTSRWRAWRTTRASSATFTLLARKGTYRVQVISRGPGGISRTATFKFAQKR